jgi:hypothetical protein
MPSAYLFATGSQDSTMVDAAVTAVDALANYSCSLSTHHEFPDVNMIRFDVTYGSYIQDGFPTLIAAGYIPQFWTAVF